MSKMYSVRVVMAVTAALLAAACFGRGSAEAHSRDFLEVFNGYDDPIIRNFYIRFSSNIDDNKNPQESSSVSARIKRRLAEKYKRPLSEVSLTTHRYIAHQWPYSGSIPLSDLLILENKYPGCKPVIIDTWRKFCRENNDVIAQEFGWLQSRSIAEAYCGFLYYTHLLGDWLPPPENTDYRYLMPVDKIVRELNKTARHMIKSDENKRFCDELNTKLSEAMMAGTSPQMQAKKVLEALKSMKLGTMLHKRFGEKGQMDETRHPYREEDEQTGLKKAA